MRNKPNPTNQQAAAQRLESATTPFIEYQRRIKTNLAPLFQLTEAAQKVIKATTSATTPFIECQRQINAQLAPVYKLTETAAIWREYTSKLQFITEQTKQTHAAATYIQEQQKEAENNLFYKLQEAELQAAKAETKQIQQKAAATAAELQKELAELQAKAAALETTLKTNFAYLCKPHQTAKEKPQNLCPNITAAQIARIHEATKGVFVATLEQWRALFANTQIQMPAPIEAAAVSDVAILLFCLYEKRIFERKKYPSIIEREKAFAVRGVPITAKQINDTRANFNFPNIGKNYIQINKAIEAAEF